MEMHSDLRDISSINSTTDTMADKHMNSVVYNNIVQSPGDQRQYRGLLLKNNMKVMLISDPTTEKAAAAMDVHIGKFKLKTESILSAGDELCSRLWLIQDSVLYHFKTEFASEFCMKYEDTPLYNPSLFFYCILIILNTFWSPAGS